LEPESPANSPSSSLAEADEAYSLLQTLTADRTFLCTDVSSNIVVLKRLDEDCLHRRQLHPSIRERLAKVRELPHPRLATLRGVERWRGMACLVWTWLDGETWDDCVGKPMENFGALASALVEAVEALHELGIVHGNLHGRNAIVRPDGQVWLTDVSPYLYTDPAADIAAVIRILDEAVPRLPAMPAERLGRLLDETAAGKSGLRELSHSLRELEAEDDTNAVIAIAKDGGYRLQSVLSAVLALLVGVGLWIGLRWYFAKAIAPLPTTFPSLKAEGR
jgi:tRNA A-37 threonylcarbamoyl transferase component Bud32